MEYNITKFDLPQNKKGIKLYAEGIRNVILDGECDPLIIAKQLKALEELVKILRKDEDIKDVIIDEYNLYGGKELRLHECKFNVKDTGVNFDYSSCCCDEYNNIIKQIEALKVEKKRLETMLKAIPIDGLVNPDTGEIMYPPIRTASTGLIVELDK